MDVDTVLKILYVGIPIISGIIGYFIRDLSNKIDVLDKKSEEFLTEAQIRLLVSDKIDPISKSLDDIKKSVDRVLDIQINNMKNNNN